MFCNNCGSKIENKFKFCPKCGIKLKVEKENKNISIKKVKLNKDEDKNVKVVKSERRKIDNVSSNEKLLSILSYLGVLSLIPYFCCDKSKFVKYHATQGLNLFLVNIIYFIVYYLLSLIKITKKVVTFNGLVGTKRVTPFMIRFPLTTFGVVLCVISIMGIIYVCLGEKKDLPLVKSIKIIK